MAKQSRSLPRSQTEKGNSAKLSTKPQGSQEKAETIPTLQEDLSMLSDLQLTRAISTGLSLAMSDSLSMVKRKSAQVRMNQTQTSQTLTNQLDQDQGNNQSS